VVIAAVGIGSLLSNPAAAHTGTGLPGGLVSGFIHPFSGIDHLLAMVSVGLWGAFLGRPLIYVLPVVFPAMMVAGAIMGMFVVPLPPVEIGIALSVLVLGGCIALSVRAPVWAASLVVALFAVFHGYAHGKELPSAADPVSYSAGFVLATGLLHVSGICLGYHGPIDSPLRSWCSGI
jgi:urease accessory protein